MRLQAIERVVTVDPRGKPLETEYTIERFESVGVSYPRFASDLGCLTSESESNC